MKWLDQQPGWKRWLVKATTFVAFAVVVLNPNLKRLFLQVKHILAPEPLLQPASPGWAEINREIDARLARLPEGSEVKAVESFILDRIRYATDYDTWGNMEYWPTATEVWQQQQEDCDGRAILAVSILRARGFPTARLVVSLDHMWAEVNAHEKEPGAPAQWTAILHPDPRFSSRLERSATARQLVALGRAFLRPAAFRETSANLLASIPFVRKVILLTALLLLCFHPCRSPRALAILFAVEVVSLVCFVKDLVPLGMAGVGAAIGWALLAQQIVGERTGGRSAAPLPQP